MRESVRKRIYWCFLVLSLIWMGVIFFFSAQPAVESAELSTGTVNWMISSFSEVSILQTLTEKGILEFLVRKLAHVAEYGVLGILLGCTIFFHKHWNFKWQLKTVALCCFYACSDELHQLFVPGRAGQIRDIVIDTIGACCAVLVLTLLLNRTLSA